MVTLKILTSTQELNSDPKSIDFADDFALKYSSNVTGGATLQVKVVIVEFLKPPDMKVIVHIRQQREAKRLAITCMQAYEHIPPTHKCLDRILLLWLERIYPKSPRSDSDRFSRSHCQL